MVKEGTATRAKSSLVTIAGKTGTAQIDGLAHEDAEKDIPKKFRDHAWFVAFAPVEAPTIAVAVLGEHMGHGGSASAPLAKEADRDLYEIESPRSFRCDGWCRCAGRGCRRTGNEMIDRVIDSRGFDNFDFRFIGLIFAILGIGVLSIYSVTHDQGVAFPFYAKQIVWIAARHGRVSRHVALGLSSDRAVSVSCLCDCPNLTGRRAA